MTITRRATPLAALTMIMVTLTGCADSAPANTDAPSDAAASVAPARSRNTGPVDPSAAANDATFGAWRRAPVKPTPEYVAAAEEACRADPAVGDAPLVVLDARGEGRAILVFADDKTAVSCIAEDDKSGTIAIDAHPIPDFAKAKPPKEADFGVHELYTLEAGGSTYSALVGQYEPTGVKSVAANFDADAAWYTAATDNGWYAIWWPGESKPLGVATSDTRNIVMHSYAP
ncbi:MAG TPA: hypothetical protein VIZ22_12340 [Candidatus Limnocylindrales bacterium]